MAEQKTKVGAAKLTINPDNAPDVAAPVSAKPAKGATFDVVDELGRTITLKKPGVLKSLDFSKAVGIGADTPEGINKMYLMEVTHLKYVAAIDGQLVSTPSSEGELRALLQRLDDEGNDAVKLGVYEHFTKNQVAAGKAEDLKNS